LTRWGWLAVLALAGCPAKKQVAPAPPPTAEAVADAYGLPARVQARFGTKIRSPNTNVNLPGGMVLELPSKAYIVLQNPVGGKEIAVNFNGSQGSLMINRGKLFGVSGDINNELGKLTGGAFTVDDIVLLLMGRLPTDKLEQLGTDGNAELYQAQDVQFRVVRAEDNFPQAITATRGDETVAEVTYAPFQQVGEHWLPSSFALGIPSADTSVELRMKSWKLLEIAPDVFSIETPKGFEARDLRDVLEDMASAPPNP